MLNRRLFVTAGLALIAAPAIVRAASLMPIKALPLDARVIIDMRPGALNYVPDDIAADLECSMYSMGGTDFLLNGRHEFIASKDVLFVNPNGIPYRVKTWEDYENEKTPSVMLTEPTTVTRDRFVIAERRYTSMSISEEIKRRAENPFLAKSDVRGKAFNGPSLTIVNGLN